jgi:hypothetical protein
VSGRPKCPACIADLEGETAGDAFVLGMILGPQLRTRFLCAHHRATAIRKEVAISIERSGVKLTAR